MVVNAFKKGMASSFALIFPEMDDFLNESQEKSAAANPIGSPFGVSDQLSETKVATLPSRDKSVQKELGKFVQKTSCHWRLNPPPPG